MNRFFAQARNLLLAGTFVFSTTPSPAEQPTADEILRGARGSQTRNEARLRAQLRTEDGTKIPFRIVLDDGVVRYQFTNPDQEIQLRLTEDASELTESTGGKSAPIRPARYDQRVRETPITYEDLALRILYWPRPKLLGEENVRTRQTWKLEIQAPRGQSQYGVARIWIEKSNGAIMRIDGFDKQGRLMKRFLVASVQKIDGLWMLKNMRIDEYDSAESGKVISRTNLEVLGRDD